MGKKVIVLGIDGATWTVIDKFSNSLKFFKKAKKEYAWGTMKSVVLPITGVAWPSMFTGTNPGKNGLFDFNKVDENYEWHDYISSADVKTKFLWEHLQEKGLKCGLINIPISSPLRSKVEFAEGGPLRKDWMNFSWPKDTTAGLNHKAPGFDKRVLEIIDLRFKQLNHIYEKKDFDFLGLVLFVHDPILHFRWKNEAFLKKVTTKIDSELEKFVKKLDKDTTLLIVSDHGMIELTRKFYIHNWLENHGYLTLKKAPKRKVLSKIGINKENYDKIMVPVVNTLVKLNLMRFIKKGFRNKFRFAVAKTIAPKKEITPDKLIDWSQTQAFGIGVQGRVILNRKDAYKEGIVSNKERNKIRKKIIMDLEKFFKKEKMKIDIYKPEDIYNGPHIDKAPDIMFIIEDGAVKVNSSYQLSKEVFSDVDQTNVLAEHNVNGIFVAVGSNISKKVKVNPHIMDVTPTVMALLGVPIPDNIDGKVLKEIFVKKPEVKKEKAENEKQAIKASIEGLSF